MSESLIPAPNQRKDMSELTVATVLEHSESWLEAEWLPVAIVLASLVVVALVLLGVGFSYAKLVLRVFEDNPSPPTLGNNYRAKTTVSGEEVEFLSTDGVRLRGVFLRPLNPVRPRPGIVVFCHEFGSDRHSAGRYCGALLDAGFTLFSFDFRSHGDSERPANYRPTQWACHRDVRDLRGALWFLDERMERAGRYEPIGLFGVSRGAAVTVLATQFHPEVAGIVVDGIYSTDHIIEGLMKRWLIIFSRFKWLAARIPMPVFRLFRWILLKTLYVKHRCKYPSVACALTQITPRPICFIHGQKDNYISCDHVRMLFELAPEPKRLWFVPEAKHNQSVDVDPEQYGSMTVALFKRAFDPSAGAGNWLSATPARPRRRWSTVPPEGRAESLRQKAHTEPSRESSVDPARPGSPNSESGSNTLAHPSTTSSSSSNGSHSGSNSGGRIGS